MLAPNASRKIGLLAVIAVLLPVLFVAAAEKSLFVTEGTILQFRSSAIRDQIQNRRQRRLYWKAVDEYTRRVEAGEEGLEKPSVNDAASINFYLGEVVPVHESAQNQTDESDGSGQAVEEEAEDSEGAEVQEVEETKEVSSLSFRDLDESDKALLRTYRRGRSCPESLKDYIPGFYDLCVSMSVRPTHKVRRGFVSENVLLHSRNRIHYQYGRPTTKERLRTLNEALDRSTRRTDLKHQPRSAGFNR